MEKSSRPTIYINGKTILLSRFTMEKYIGRKLLTTELVHHIDGNNKNNNIKNLKIVSRSEHKKIHNKIGFNTRYKIQHNLEKYKNKIIKKYNRGYSCYNIAKIYKCHRMTISRFLLKVLGTCNLKQYRKEKCYE